jgi:AraC-like DNA-binding protein
MGGASLSTAAHAAGYADSAHLTRTSRRMFGIPPSLMNLSAPSSREIAVSFKATPGLRLRFAMPLRGYLRMCEEAVTGEG